MNRNDKEFLVRKIRTEYSEKQPSELDALKELDARVKRPANVFAYTFGSFSALVMGTGMSLVMTGIGTVIGLAAGAATAPGIVIGSVGLVLALLNYPIYKGILNSRKQKYAPEILSLSERLMKQD